MILKKLKTSVITTTLAFFCAGQASASIVSVINNNSLDNNDVYQIGILEEDVNAFIDRNHQYNDIPSNLIGADFVQVANDDKAATALTIDVSVNTDSIFYLFLDNRINVASAMTWVASHGFTDTGLDIGIDEGADGSINETSSIYSKFVSAGTTTTLQQNDGNSRNMYGIAVIPN